MKSNTIYSVLKILGVVLCLSLTVVACSKKKVTSGDGEPMRAEIDEGRADSDNDNAMGLVTVNFPFDSFELTPAAVEGLENNYQILNENSNINVQIEGHCDERGGIQYNLALGEKRANAVRKKLVSMGISGSRLTTISYGKERPIALGQSESAWGMNRRANFVITDN